MHTLDKHNGVVSIPCRHCKQKFLGIAKKNERVSDVCQKAKLAIGNINKHRVTNHKLNLESAKLIIGSNNNREIEIIGACIATALKGQFINEYQEYRHNKAYDRLINKSNRFKPY